jgi:hypothetical protein
MKLTRYHYTGPDSSVSLRLGEDLLDVQLRHAHETMLPADHDYTQALLAQKLLQPANGEPAPTDSQQEVPAEPTRKGAK